MLGFILPGLAPFAHAVQASFGLNLLEEGDDRQRAGVSFLADGTTVSGHVHYDGRTYGPVTQRTLLVTVNRCEPLPFARSLVAFVGGALLSEATIITYKGDAAGNSSEARYNVGVSFGTFWTYRTRGPLSFTVLWESALFAAGLDGGLLLATGRKQILALASGIDF